MSDNTERDFNKLELGDLNYYLIKNMQNTLNEESEIRDNTLFIPEFSLSIRPNVVKSDNNMAVIDYYLYSENWDREIFECCASVGNDKKHALGMAEGSFLFGIMTGIRYMAGEEYFQEIETEFNGSHLWKVYRSDIVGMGEIPETTSSNEMWDVIKEEIPKYIGNQKIVYVKVFAAKNGDRITGECRVNDGAVKELGDLISKYAAEWDTSHFGSKKQFFFFVQEDETYTPYPYDDETIEKFVLETAYMFEKIKTEEEYDNFIISLGERIKDYDLAEELINFIPEICAERAFPNINYPEKVIIYIGGEENYEINKTQIGSYYSIKKAVNHLIDHGHILKELYHKYIGVSSIYNVICRAKEKDSMYLTREGTVISVAYGFSEEYKLR